MTKSLLTEERSYTITYGDRRSIWIKLRSHKDRDDLLKSFKAFRILANPVDDNLSIMIDLNSLIHYCLTAMRF